MSMVGFPLLLIPLAIYNIIVFLMPGVSLAEPLVKLTLMSGAEWPVTLSDMLADARHPVAAAGGHQGRATRCEISHRSSVVADRVRRRGRRIRAVAALRHLDLFPADHAGAGGFPVGHRAARTARNAGRVNRCGLAAGRPNGCRPARTSIRTGTCTVDTAGGFGRRIRAARSTPSRKSCMPRSRRADHRRRSCPRDCSRATARRPRRTRRRADVLS